ncbi:MAG TPA: flagellar basal body-associated FliL family protein [Rhodospirillaceae bacterium]|nr:flagellar basal body-associated FliL family protein [Rhodospirillaceae bacterium]
MKKIILIVVALLLLGGGGFAAFTFFGGKSAEASIDPKHAAKDKSEAETAASKKETDAKVAFVKMDPLTLPVVNKNGVVQIVNISITLEVEDAEKAKEIEKFTPRLKDAYIQDMYGALGSAAALTSNGVVEVNTVKKRLNAVTQKVLGNDSVRDVLLQAVQQRKA